MKITLKELMRPMFLAYGSAVLGCIVLFFAIMLGFSILFQGDAGGYAGLAILPILTPLFIFLPVLILTICIKKFLSPRFSLANSFIIAALSLILGFPLSSFLTNISSNLILHVIYAFGGAYLTGLFVAVLTTKHVGRRVFFVILAIALMALAGFITWQYTHPVERIPLSSFSAEDRKDIAEAARLTAELPTNRERVLERGLVPTYPPETKIALDQETWKSNAWTDSLNHDEYYEAYFGSAYATIQPSGQRVVIRFARESGKWYIAQVSTKPRQD